MGSCSVDAIAVVAGVGLLSCSPLRTNVWAQDADRGLLSLHFAGAIGIAALPRGRFATACLKVATISGFGIGSTRTLDPKTVEVWDARSGKRVFELRGHTATVRCVAALPIVSGGGGILIASGSDDNTVRLWKAETGELERPLQGHQGAVNALAALPDGRFASGSNDGSVILWDLMRNSSSVLLHPVSVCALAVLNSRLASGCSNGRVHVWSLTGGVQEAELPGHAGAVRALAALPNGLLASGGDDRVVRVWDVDSRACVAAVEGHAGSVVALAPLPQDHASNPASVRFASGAKSDPLVRVWTLAKSGTPEAAAAEVAQWHCAEVEHGPRV